MSEPLLQGRGLSKRYPSGRATIDVLQGLDLDIAVGESLAVVGVSGVGKSTLLHLLGGLDRPDDGTLRFEGNDLLGLSDSALRRYRNRDVGFVFQFHHLLPEFTAQENVEMPLRIAGAGGDFRQQARDLLVRLGLEARLHHHPGKLSGGEQQRVAIARAVVASPRLVLADEPTGNLDPKTGEAVFATLAELQRERRFALVLASHSDRLARACDRVLRLEAGRLTQLDTGEVDAYFGDLGAKA